MEESESGNSKEALTRKNNKVYKVYKYRFVALFSYILIMAYSQIKLCYTLPLMHIMQDAYEINIEDWMMLNAYLHLLSIPSLLVAIPLIEKRGVHISLFIGAVGVLATAWCMTAINYHIYFMAINFTLFPLFVVFYRVAITKVSVRWFPPSQRIMATFTTNIFCDLAVFLGSFIPTWYVETPPKDSKWTPQLKDHIKHQIYKGFLMEAILGSVMFTTAILLYREKPKSPPSPADDNISNKKKSEIIKGVLRLARNKNFLIVLLGHIFFLTMFELSLGNKAMIYSPFDVDAEKATSYSMMAGVVAGSISSIITGIFLNKSKRFKLAICLSMFLTAGAMAANTFIPFLNSVWWIVLGSAFTAFCSGPEMSIAQEFACELGYPVGESLIIGLITLLYNPLTIISQEAIKDMINYPTKTKSLIFGLVTAAVYLCFGIAVLFVNEDLRRDRRDTSIMDGLPFEADYLHSFAEPSLNQLDESEFQLTPLTPIPALLNSQNTNT